MKEDFLHFIWQHKLLSLVNLQTTEKEAIEIVHKGMYNTNSGCDFLNAKIKINNQLWAGNIEFHVNSSDWYLHKHEKDKNYDTVILHIVWNNDSVIFMKNNIPLPTIELKNFVDKKLLDRYEKLFNNKQRWIACEKQIKTVNKFVLNNWMERLYIERLEQKSILIKKLLKDSNNDFEAVLFLLLFKNFGLKVNGEAFFNLAKSIPFSIIRKVCYQENYLAALLFGQAGFFEEKHQDNYFNILKKEYTYLKHKYALNNLNNNQFQFFRMRPGNFPTIRIAQIVALYNSHQNLFSKLMTISNLKDFYTLFSVEINSYWKTHYTFKTPSKKTPKKLTKSFIDLLLINTIIPLKFVYLKNAREITEKDFLNLIIQLKPEKNAIISKFYELKIIAKNALESQAILQLKNQYCSNKYCLKCAIGNNLLRN